MTTNDTHPLFVPCHLGGLGLRNRVVMAPMTRSRATAGHVPTELMVTFYAQRASAGLLITEGTAPSPNGTGYARIPGIYNEEHVRAWRRVTAAVHRQGGRIFVQLMHTGRVSHPLNMPAGARILAPSAVGLSGTMWTDAQGAQPYPVPAAMTEADIRQAIGEFGDAAALALEAGFDGVELHGANGYLLDQFLNTAANRRTDTWGGAVANRLRFAVEAAARVAAGIGAARVGMRLSPYGVFNDMTPDPAMDQLYEQLADALNAPGLAYLHIVDHSAMGAPPVKPEIKQALRARFKGTVILSGGYDLVRAGSDLAAGKGDLIAFGRPFIANPDLPRRLQAGLALAAPDANTFYTPGEKGYIDYAPAGAAG
ncbi:MAG: alkene reductase [Kiritimatiellaeota bacterium]|nr:alkene reductase [Kiritimatiellota bacterium]